ncbi:hypothetical protein [Nonomuraea turkmeniaca]|uniref:hypothetical protein n=1 Tax=Nonomuraea turkmeniaca TaxID=103838 RepID=UPI003CCC4DFB
MWFTEHEWRTTTDHWGLVKSLDWPMYVNPAGMGSSIGISRGTSMEELRAGVVPALAYDRSGRRRAGCDRARAQLRRARRRRSHTAPTSAHRDDDAPLRPAARCLDDRGPRRRPSGAALPQNDQDAGVRPGTGPLLSRRQTAGPAALATRFGVPGTPQRSPDGEPYFPGRHPTRLYERHRHS